MHYIPFIKPDYIVHKVAQDVRLVESTMYKLQYKGKNENA